jgi:hypothetical protein
MEGTDISNVPKITRSFSGIRMFKPTRSISADARNSVSRDLGCYSMDGNGSTPIRPEDEDSIMIQLEGGLFGITNEKMKGTGTNNTGDGVGSYFPFQRQGKKQVDRSMSNQSIDPDHFLWSNDNNENAAIPMK